MMRTIHIEILRCHVTRKTMLMSAYKAAKRQDADEWSDIIPLVEEDDELLRQFWRRSCARLHAFLCEKLRRTDHRAPDIGYDGHSFHVAIMVDACLGDGFRDLLASAMSAFLQSDIFAHWMAIVLPENEPRCRADADEMLDAMARIFAVHRRPMRVRKRMEVI